MSEGAWFYDNWVEEDDHKIIDVERIYCFDWDLCSDSHMKKLDRIYTELPEYYGYAVGCPYWFGDDDNRIPHVWASVEPPGLQVAGVLARKDWEAWHQAFWEKIQDFPFREQW